MAEYVKKNEILNLYAGSEDLTLRQIKDDMVEVVTPKGTVIGVYQRILKLGWTELEMKTW